MEDKDFQRDLEFIRTYLKKMQKHEPPYELVEKTRILCHQKLAKRILSPSVPKSIWIAFALSVIIIGVLMLPFTKSLKLGQPFTLQNAGILILIAQNACMLFFAPVIFRKLKEKQNRGSNALTT
jgi:hypothetical protein